MTYDNVLMYAASSPFHLVPTHQVIIKEPKKNILNGVCIILLVYSTMAVFCLNDA